MEDNESRFMTWLGLAGVTVLLSAFFLTLFGIVDLRVVGIECDNLIVRFLVNYTLLAVNGYYVFSISLGKTSLLSVALFLPISFIVNIVFDNSVIISFLLPFLYIVIYNLVRKEMKQKQLVINFLLCCIITSIYQLLSCTVKIYSFNINYLNSDWMTNVLISIDLFLFYYFFKKGACNNYVGLHTKFLFLPKSKSIRQSKEPSEEVLNVEELTKRQERIFLLLASGYQIFQLLVVLGIGMINNMILELIIMLIVFWNGRKILGNCWHSEKLSMCSIATFSGFYILTKITPPLSISLFLVIALCGAFTYFMYLLGNKADRLEELENKYETDFTKYGLTKEMADFAYDYKVDGISLKEQSDKTGLPIATVKKYRTRVNNAIKNN